MITDYIAQYFLYFKTIHIIAMTAWMAGLLYLPRLFVYHTKIVKNQQANQLFKQMEQKTLKIIMLPAMIVTITTGLALAYVIGFKDNAWLHLKMLLVLCLFFTHHLMIKYAKSFLHDNCQKSERFFRIFNEIPTVLLICIVILAVLQPF